MARKGQTTTTQGETTESTSKSHVPPSSVRPKPVRESGQRQEPTDKAETPSKGLGAVENEVIQSTPPTDSLVDLFDETGHDQDKDHGDLDPRDELTPG